VTPPFFSIVTVTRNAAAVLAPTAGSLFAQDCDDFEWLVIDGASTDDTVARARAWLRPGRDRLLSAPDRGLYHAMNRGLWLARGQAVAFLNADDRLAGPDVLATVRAAFGPEVDAVYGDSVMLLPDGATRYRRASGMRRLLAGRIPCTHQALFVRRAVHLAHPFDETLRTAADFGVMAGLLRGGARFVHLPVAININTVPADAVSVRGRALSHREYGRVLREVAGLPSWRVAVIGYRRRAKTALTGLLLRLPAGLRRRLPRAIRDRLY
jgi:putative colanic acid biosynthesis glycosyltransferase